MNSVQATVAQQIIDLGPKLQDKIVGVMVDRELVKRTDVLVRSMDDLVKMEKEYDKLTPDQKSFDEAGNKISEYFSQKRLDERNKLKGKIDKLTKSINKALDDGDFNDVNNFAKNAKNESGVGSSEEVAI